MKTIWRIGLLAGLYAAGVFAAVEPQAITINHPHDKVIHAQRVGRLDRSGLSDVSGALNKLLMDVFSAGGGTVYLPAGRYRIDQPVFVPPGTALRGDFVLPGRQEVDPEKNTVICAYYGRGMDAQADPLFFLDGSALIDGLVIWYPEQVADRIVSYAPAIRHDARLARWAINASTRNVFLVNAYTGIQLGKAERGTCIQLIKNIAGTPLSTGIEVWRDADIPRILNVDFNPDYWPAAGLGGSPVDRKLLKQHLFENASGITYHRCDGSELADIKVRGYHKGLNLSDGHRLDNGVWLDNEGHYINFQITGCKYAVWIKNIKNHGTQFYNCRLEGEHSAVFVDNPMHGKECAMFMGCELRGGQAAVAQSWEGQPNSRFSLMFTACRFGSPVEWTGGNLSVVDCDFNFKGKHLSIGPETGKAIIADSRFKGKRMIENLAGNRVKISESCKSYIRPPEYTYAVNRISDYAPPSDRTVVVSAGDGKTGDAGRIQEAIDRVSREGGGYVLLSPGFYLLGNPLTVRANVELRGPVQAWQHSKFLSWYAVEGAPKGAVIYVEYGRDAVDSAVITLEENAGLDGLFFHYPGQAFDARTQEVLHRYGWLIRAEGDRAYVKHVTASNPWRFLDLSASGVKDNYVGYCNGAALDQGIFVGEAENCMIDNVHFNSWYWNTVYFPNKPSESNPKTGFKEQLDNWMKANSKAFLFAGSRNVDVYGSFTFCAKQGFTLLPGKTTGRGPSGIIINSGNDWSKFGMVMHANDGLVFANMHFIDVDQFDPDRNISSILVAEGCGDAVSLYNVSTWGTSHRAFAMLGEESSQVDIFNFSYQLYFPQVNSISNGTVRVTNAIRNVPGHPMMLEMGDNARFVMRAGIFPTGLTVSPAHHSGVTRSISFPD